MRAGDRDRWQPAMTIIDRPAIDAQIADECQQLGLQIERRATGWQVAGTLAYNGPERRMRNWRIEGYSAGNHMLIDVTGMTPIQAVRKAQEQIVRARRQYNAYFHQQLFQSNEKYLKQLFSPDA